MNSINAPLPYLNDNSSHQDGFEFGTPSLCPCFRKDSLLESTTLELAYSMEVSEQMSRIAVLGVMATACQGLFDVAYPNGKEKTSTSLMTCIIAGSSERKTTLKRWTDRPIKDFEVSQVKIRRNQSLVAQRHHANWKIKVKALEKSLAKEIINEAEPTKITCIENQLIALQSEEPQPHRNIRIIYENATPGALALGLYENVPYACLSSSEAGNLLNGPTFRDLHIFNSIYSGSTITIDRASQPSFIIVDPRLSINLMLQPSAMERFLATKGSEANDNGFLSRFLFIAPEGMAGKRSNERPPVADHVEQAFYTRVKDLLTESIKNFENGNSRRNLMFSSKAKILWKDIFSSIESQINEGGVYYYSKEHASKLMENITRTSGIIHAFEGYEGDIEPSTLEHAYAICQECSQHFLRHIAEEPEVVKLTNLLVQDIRRLTHPHQGVFRFNKSLLQQRGSGKLRHNKNRSIAIDTLVKLGHLKPPRGHNSEYEFQDVVWPDIDPELKNGKEITVSELPLWADQRLINIDSRGRYGSERIVKNPHQH